MKLELKEIYTKVKETFPGKVIQFSLDKSISEISRSIGGMHNNYRVTVIVNEYESSVDIVHVDVVFCCEAVPAIYK